MSKVTQWCADAHHASLPTRAWPHARVYFKLQHSCVLCNAYFALTHCDTFRTWPRHQLGNATSCTATEKYAVYVVACCSGPSKQRVANGCVMVYAVLTAVLEWANYQPVIVASVDCLRLMLHYLNTGGPQSRCTSTLPCSAVLCSIWVITWVALHCITVPLYPPSVLERVCLLQPYSRAEYLYLFSEDRLCFHHKLPAQAWHMQPTLE